MTQSSLSGRSDHELIADTHRLVGTHRELTARLVMHLAEIEDRRLHLQAGFSSMFDYCVRELRMSEGEAFRRIVAARLGRRFPLVYSLLASGAVHLSALELLHEHLTEENHAELLAAASGKSKREVETLLAVRFPKPDVPSRIRARIEPLSEARYRVEFTASAELREKLELCRDLMSHANPSRDLGPVVERAVDLLLADLERKRLCKTKRSRRGAKDSEAKTGRVARATRRRVFERDGVHCTYVSPEGRRCDARAFLELDHRDPRGLGGGDDSENMRVRCRAHNQLWAEQTYGRAHIERRRNLRQQKSTSIRALEIRRAEAAQAGGSGPTSSCEKVRLALRGMGFRAAEARRAVTEVARKHGEVPPIEQALREAILVATA